MNNAVYHAIFDSIINIYLIRHSRRESGGGPVGVMVHTECDYVKPIAYPEAYLAGMAVTKIGNSSVNYKVRNYSSQVNFNHGPGTGYHLRWQMFLECAILNSAYECTLRSARIQS